MFLWKSRKHQVVSKGTSHENLGQLQGDLFLACLLYHGQMGGSSSCRFVPKMQAGWMSWKDIRRYMIYAYRYIWGHMRYTKRLKNYGAKGTISNCGAILKETSIEDVHSSDPWIHGLHFRHMGWASPDHSGKDSSYCCCQGIMQWATDPVS